jgi:protein-S-isoprenylcysteine O-methyltransferase Ste14
VLVAAVEIAYAGGWAAFWLYWLVAAFSAKRGHVQWGRELRIRALIVVLLLMSIRLGAFRHVLVTREAWREALGLLLLVSGLAFAVWARVVIGRSWGGPMTRKDDPELVTSGPYRFVRHPIYSGILLAALGTAVGLTWSWLVVFALATLYFLYSATVEERYLTDQFAEPYPAYQRATKMLVPFLF